MIRKIRKQIDYYWYNHSKLASSKELEEKKWYEIIAAIKVKYEGTEFGNLICYRYEMKFKEEKICDLLHIERPTYYAWLNKINNEVTLRAAYERLIKPF